MRRRFAILTAFLLIHADIANGEDRTKWINGTIDDALRVAGESDRMVLAYCWEEKEERSVAFYNTLTVESVMKAMEGWACFSAKKGSPEGDEAIKRYSVNSFPTVLFLTAEGELEDLVGGTMNPTPFVSEMARVGRGEGTLRQLQAAAADTEDAGNLDARFNLVFRYRSLGDAEKEQAELDAILAADKKGATITGARVHLIGVMRQMAEDAEDRAFGFDWDGARLSFRGATRDWSLKPLYAWAKKVKNPRGKFDAWDTIAEHEWTRQNRKAALSASTQAQKGVPDDRALDWCADLARKIMGLRGERPTSQKKFALRLATDCSKRARKVDGEAEDFAKRFPGLTKDAVIAKYTEPLAYAQKYNGQHGKALATIEKCIKLDPENKQYVSTQELLKSGTWPPPPTDDG